MDNIIGLIGAKGAGKTTAFNAINELYNTVQEITLAGKLKDACSKVLDIPRNYFEDHRFKEKEFENPIYLKNLNIQAIWDCYVSLPFIEPSLFFDGHIRPHIGKVLFTPRQVAQYVGTEILRAYEPDIHCRTAVEGVVAKTGVVTDIRFPNELDYFQTKYPEFHPIYIKNMSAEIRAAKDTHASEAHLKDLALKSEFVIVNNSSIADFKDSVARVIKIIMEK